ncbi:MAG: DNA repair protein RecO [Candidatus Nealsonbacteria bacterium]|nr:MAG: DNA repair protein RecO [Candidatus Nealsonbacteria bacterium]
MFRHYRTQGFILKKTDRGEADRIFTIYTKDFGKLEILAKAERKIKSKLKGGLELFYLSEIEFIQGKTHKTLTDAILIENFPILRKDLERLPIAYRISEVLDNLIKGQEADEKIWNLLNEIFNKLNSLEIRLQPTRHPPESHLLKLEILYYYFLWNLLSILGYQPELYNCSLCQKKLLPEKLYWSPKEGGIICQSCFRKTKSGEKIESEIIKILRIILEKNWQTLSKLKIEPNYLKSLNSIAESYLSHVLEGVK